MIDTTSSCQVVKLLGSNVHLVHKEFLALLQDDALEVRGHAHHQHCPTNHECHVFSCGCLSRDFGFEMTEHWHLFFLDYLILIVLYFNISILFIEISFLHHHSAAQIFLVFRCLFCGLMSHEAFTDVVVVVEVLDALMNHLEDTLEAVLSRGENLTLDNKVGK